MQKQPYITPAITVVEFRSERGFASTGIVVPEVGTFELFYNQQSGQETESFITHDTWTDGSNGFWQ